MHLTKAQAQAALNRRSAIEQMLTRPADTANTLHWVDIRPVANAFEVRLHHVYNDGDPSFLDLQEFRPVSDEDEVGEGVALGTYPSAAVALAFAAAEPLFARSERWVNVGLAQDEYADLERAWSNRLRMTGAELADLLIPAASPDEANALAEILDRYTSVTFDEVKVDEMAKIYRVRAKYSALAVEPATKFATFQGRLHMSALSSETRSLYVWVDDKKQRVTHVLGQNRTHQNTPERSRT